MSDHRQLWNSDDASVATDDVMDYCGDVFGVMQGCHFGRRHRGTGTTFPISSASSKHDTPQGFEKGENTIEGGEGFGNWRGVGMCPPLPRPVSPSPLILHPSPSILSSVYSSSDYGSLTTSIVKAEEDADHVLHLSQLEDAFNSDTPALIRDNDYCRGGDSINIKPSSLISLLLIDDDYVMEKRKQSHELSRRDGEAGEGSGGMRSPERDTKGSVRFQDPPVTSVRGRPRTRSKDVGSLYFTEKEMSQIERDRRAEISRVDDDLECIALSMNERGLVEGEGGSSVTGQKNDLTSRSVAVTWSMSRNSKMSEDGLEVRSMDNNHDDNTDELRRSKWQENAKGGGGSGKELAEGRRRRGWRKKNDRFYMLVGVEDIICGSDDNMVPVYPQGRVLVEI